MRWYIASGLLLLLLALTESSVLPTALSNAIRPNLVLIVSAVWAALRGSDGFAWALAGGLMLDLMSSVPLGLTSLSLLVGNVVATLLDRAPIPSRLFRATTWVAIVTVVSHGIILMGLALSGRYVDVPYAMTTVILPLMLLNPVLAIPTYAILNTIQQRVRRQQSLPGVAPSTASLS
jgi:rod shape-determining protein MreD